MRKTFSPLVVLAACAQMMSVQAQNVWNNAAGTTNWSTPGNWSFGAAPTPGDTVVFDNNPPPGPAAGVLDNIVDTGFAINNLYYQTASSNGFHATLIPGGISLDLNSSAGSNAMIYVGTGISLNGESVTARFFGGGTLSVTNTSGVINIVQGGANVDHRATLDLSGLTNFYANVGQIWIGVQEDITFGVRPMGAFLLADTNFVATPAGVTKPGIMVASYPTGDTNLRGTQQMFFGRNNVINADAISIGGHKSTGLMTFRTGMTGGFASLRGSAGASDKVKLMTIGDQRAGSIAYDRSNTSTSNSGTLDTTGNILDLLVADLYVARSQTNNNGVTTGVLTFDQGTIAADNINVGYHPSPAAGSGTFNAVGTINVNGSATLTANNDMVLGRKVGPTTPIATLNISGNGMVNVKGNIVSTNGSSTINFNGGTINMQPGGDPAPGFIGVSTLSGSGTILNAANITNLSSLTPGTTTNAGTLAIGGNLTLAANALLNLNITNSTVVGSGVNDLVSVAGNLNLNNNGLTILPMSTTLDPGSYRLIDFTGTRSGSFNFTNLTRYTAAIAYAPNQVNLALSGGGPGNVRWASTANTNWDVTTTNWFNTDTSVADRFLQLDNVLVNDAGIFQTNLWLTTTLFPGGVTVNAATNYFFTGPGKISGAASLTKSGTGTLTITNVNDFGGPVTVTGGILRVGNASALGTTNGSTTVASGGTLDVFGTSLFSPGELITIAGTGLNNTGAVINTGAAQNNAIRFLTLSDNAMVRVDNRFDVRGPGGASSFSGAADLRGFTLTKLGAAQMSLVDSFVTNAGSIEIGGGVLGLTRSQIDGPGYINISSNVLFFENFSTGYVAKPFSVNGGTVRASGNAVTLGVPITNLAGLTVDNSVALTHTNVISGAGYLTKIGSSILTLNANDTYSGPTTVSVGTLILSTNGSIASTPSISLASGTTFDVSAVSGGFVLGGSQTLSGSGRVIGDVTAQAGSTIIAGGSPGTLSFSNNLSLNGVTNVFELDSDPSIIGGTGNDLVTVAGNLTLIGVNRIKLAPIGPLDTTTPYTVITYSGTLSGVLANLQAISDNPRYTFSIVDPATTPGSIQVAVTGLPVSLVWKGGQVSNPTAWNLVTPNWFNTGTSLPDVFYAGDSTVFDDSANTNVVTLIGTIQPGNMTVNNNSLAYALGGAGSLVAGSLAKDGIASLIISNSSANTINGGVSIAAGSVIFTNGGGNTFGVGATVAVNGGTLTLANSGINSFNKGLVVANGNVLVANPAANSFGPDILLEGGNLTFNQSVDVTVSAVISNSVPLTAGTLTKNGTNLLTLSGNNGSFDGAVQINSGTIKASNGNALGNANGATTIATGGALDVNAQNLGSKPITVSGSGPAGAGAIINTGAAQNNALGSVTLADNTTVGGTGRFDIRNSPALLSTGGNAYNLTKVGANQFSLVSVTVDSMLADVDVQGGIFSVELTSTLGDPLKTARIWSGATLQLWAMTAANPFNKFLVLSNNATLLNGSGVDIVSSAVSVNGAVTFNIGGTSLEVDGDISGQGSLNKTTGNPLILNGNNTYAGGTTIAAGTLQLGLNGTTGNLPPAIGGTITNNGTLVFNRSDDVTMADHIVGSGAVQQIAGGTLFVTASNSYAGQTLINTSSGNSPGGAALRISHNNALGDAVGNTRVAGNTTGNGRLELVGGITVPEPLVIDCRQSAMIDVPAVLNISGNNTLTGPVTGSTGGSDMNFQSDSGKLTMAGTFNCVSTAGTRRLKLMGAGLGEWSGIIANSADTLVATLISKVGSGAWTLSAANIYRGSTTIREGTLALAATGSISNSATIDVQAGATFDVSARPGMTVTTNQTIKGNGSVIGSITIGANGTLSAGESVGTLAISGALSLASGSTNITEIDLSNAVNDVVTAASVAYGGTLVVNEISGSSFVSGSTFKIFDASSYTGSFAAAVLPALDAGLAWDLSKLSVDGTIKVGPSSVNTSPTSLSAQVVGNSLDISWPADHTGWRLEGQTNAPNAGLTSNWFTVPGSTGTNRVIMTIDPSNGSVFYRIVYP